MPPELFRSLPSRGFILFHPDGIAPGCTVEVPGEQRDDIPAFEYSPRRDISEYMNAL